MFSLKLDHTKPAKSKDPKDYKHRRQAGAARRHPGQGDRALHLYPQFPRARHAARRAWCGRRRSAPSSKASTKARSRRSPASSRSCARAISSAWWRRTNGPRSRPRRCSRPPGRNGRGCPNRRSCSSTCAATKVVEDQVTSNVGDTTSRDGQGRRAQGRRQPTTSPSIPTARSARPARSPSSRTASSPPGRPRRRRTTCASSSREMLAAAGRERALRLSRRLGLLRPQRPRGRGGRRRPAGQGGRPAGAGAVVARRRARLGAARAADADRSARGAGRRRQRHGLGVGILHSAADGRKLHGAADVRATLAGLPAKPDIAPGNIFQNSAIPYKFANVEAVCHRLETTPFRPVLDQDAGADAEHLCQRVLHRRARGRGQGRPDRVPPEVPRSRRQARHRGAQPRSRRLRSGTSGRRRSATASGNVATGPRRLVCEIRAGRAPMWASSPRWRSIAHARRDQGAEGLHHARLRPDHQSGRACATSSRATSSRP